MDRSSESWSPNSPPAPARATCSGRYLPSATRSSRSIRFRTPRRKNSPRCVGFSNAHMRRAGSHSCRAGLSIRSVRATAFSPRSIWSSADIAGSVTSDGDGFPPHIALPDAAPGTVEIWEPIEPDKRPEIEGWDAPFDTVSETSPRVKLAQRIARTVRHLVDAGEPVGTDRHATRYGDVLILVRQRGELFEVDHSRAEERKSGSRRRRPPGADRTYRGHGSYRSGPGTAAAGRRPRASDRAAESAVRFQRRRFVCHRVGSRPDVAARRPYGQEG